MNLHANARTTPNTRLLLVQRVLNEDWRVSDAASALGISRATAYKWLWRFESEGLRGLQDRSSAPHRVWNRTKEWVRRRIEKLRRKRLIAWAIARRVKVALSTVGGILRQLGLGRLSALDSKEPAVRYERELMNPREALSLGSISQIVMPSDLRQVLAENLAFYLRHYKPEPLQSVQREFH